MTLDLASILCPEHADHDLALAREDAKRDAQRDLVLQAAAIAYELRNDPQGLAADGFTLLSLLEPMVGPLFRELIYRDGLRPKPGETLRDVARPADLLRIAAHVFEVTSPWSGDPRLFQRFEDDDNLRSKGLPPRIAVTPLVGGKAASRALRIGRCKVDLPLIHDITVLIAHYFAGRDGGSWLGHHESRFFGHHGELQRRRLNRAVAKEFRAAARACGVAVSRRRVIPASSIPVMFVIVRFLSLEGVAALAEAREKLFNRELIT